MSRVDMLLSTTLLASALARPSPLDMLVITLGVFSLAMLASTLLTLVVI